MADRIRRRPGGGPGVGNGAHAMCACVQGNHTPTRRLIATRPRWTPAWRDALVAAYAARRGSASGCAVIRAWRAALAADGVVTRGDAPRRAVR